MLLGALWIVATSGFAGESVHDVEVLAAWEVAKGLVYVLVTGALLFGLLWYVFTSRESLLREALAWRARTARVERQAIAGLLASTVAHDINNVLAILSYTADEAPQGHQEGLTRLENLARRLHDLGKDTESEPVVPVNLDAAIPEIVRFSSAHQHFRGRRVSADIPQAVRVRAPRLLLDRALLNNLLNAGEATPTGGRITVTAGTEPKPWLYVDDDGPGLPEHPDRLLSAGATTRLRGSGLGLLTLQALAERVGGEVVLERSPTHRGARVGVRWG
jgi:signal transduction histidine kinase